MNKEEYTKLARSHGYEGEIKGPVCERCGEEFFDHALSYDAEFAGLGKFDCLCGDCYNGLFWWSVRSSQ